MLLGAIGATHGAVPGIQPLVSPVVVLPTEWPGEGHHETVTALGEATPIPPRAPPTRFSFDGGPPPATVDVELPPVPGLPPPLGLLPRGLEATEGAIASQVESVATTFSGLADTMPRLIGALSPVYPRSLREAGVEGRVLLEFVVDTSGMVAGNTIRVLGAALPAFVESATSALRAGRFQAGWSAGRRAAVLVRQSIVFRIR